MSSISPFYSHMHQQVVATLQQPAAGKTWFRANRLRSEVYDLTKLLFFNEEIDAQFANEFVIRSIWWTCILTAPVALSLIAPKESYREKIIAILYMTCAFDANCFIPVPHLESGMEALSRVLLGSVEEGKGIAVLCNLFMGGHAFLIEKRSNTECVVYQSSLVKNDDLSYTFAEFLEDPLKHVSRTPENLLGILMQILSVHIPIEERVRNCVELFFHCPFDNWNQKDTYNDPLLFVSTTPFILQSVKPLIKESI